MTKHSMKTKLIIIAILFILYPTIIIGYLGYVNYSKMIKEKAIVDYQSAANQLTQSLSDRMDKLTLFSIQLFYDRKIIDTNTLINSNNLDFIYENSFQQYLQSLLFSKYELNEILIKYSVSEKVFQANRTFVATTDCYANMDKLNTIALKGKGAPVWYVTSKNGKIDGIYLAKSIYGSLDVNKAVGLLAFKIDNQYFMEVFNNILINSKQTLGLYNSHGQLIFINNSFDVNSNKSIQSFIDSNLDKGEEEIKTKNDSIYMIYDTIRPANWKLVVGISGNVLFKDLRKVAKFSIILCIATLPICLLLINYLHSTIIRPLNLLIKRMKEIENGNMGVIIESNRKDEFGFVFRTFNKMSENIKNLIDTVYKEQLVMKQSEINALQAQINPHFLYNTLESINWKAKIHGDDEVSEMISAFSYIIEANLNRSNEKFIPVYKEIEYIQSYKFLIQKRFGKKIEFNLNIDEDTLNNRLPKLLIQPIIENTIYHGLEMKKGGGTVDITIKKENNQLIITVVDDGLGIEKSKLLALIEDMSDDKFSESENILDNSKIGIINVHRRIRLLYGKEYGVKIESKEGMWTIVTIKVPGNI
ncbi:MAG: cache domain-containing sensor histidine kinase [Clostridium sp.]|uniref:cache domain-containing sensor histidine kinase n=1 Tax=Clostridium sp. TaxID=1506 RepID=UPI003D6CF256